MNLGHKLFQTSSVVATVLVMAAVFLLGRGVLETLPHNSSFGAVYVSALVQNTNDARKNIVGEDGLVENRLLTQAAQLKANDMAAKGYFAHNSPDGKTPWYWFNQVGYAYRFAGENLAVNFIDSKDVTDAWLASPGHRANILNPLMTETGLAVATGTFQGNSAIFVVQLFAAPIAPSIVPRIPTGALSPNAAALALTDSSLVNRILAQPRNTLLYIYCIFLFLVIVVMALALKRSSGRRLQICLGGAVIIIALTVCIVLILGLNQGTI